MISRTARSHDICDLQDKLQSLRKNAKPKDVIPEFEDGEITKIPELSEFGLQVRTCKDELPSSEDMPSDKEVSQSMASNATSEWSHRHLRYKYDECLETDHYGSQVGHESAKMISIDESIKLIREQHKRNEVRTQLSNNY